MSSWGQSFRTGGRCGSSAQAITRAPGGSRCEIAGKGLLDVGQVPVVVQVLPVQVGDDGDLGGEMREGAVGLVGLRPRRTRPGPGWRWTPGRPTRAPTTTVGSRFPARRTAAVMAVVEVLPCMPVTATWVCPSMSRASICPRRSTVSPRARAAASSGLSSLTAVEWTTTSASPRFSAWWPKWTRTPRVSRRRVMAPAARSEPLTRSPWRTKSSARPLMPMPPTPMKW